MGECEKESNVSPLSSSPITEAKDSEVVGTSGKEFKSLAFKMTNDLREDSNKPMDSLDTVGPTGSPSTWETEPGGM